MFKFFKKLFKSNPRKKGRRLAMAALLSFSAESDVFKFRSIRNHLQSILTERRLLSATMIQSFQHQLATELKVNPILFSMIMAEMLTYADPEEPEGQKELFLFLEGIIEAINIVYPSTS